MCVQITAFTVKLSPESEMQCVITAFEFVREKSKSVTIQKYFSAVLFVIFLKLISIVKEI